MSPDGFSDTAILSAIATLEDNEGYDEVNGWCVDRLDEPFAPPSKRCEKQMKFWEEKKKLDSVEEEDDVAEASLPNLEVPIHTPSRKRKMC